MKKISLPLIFDVLFYMFCVFLPLVGALRFYRLPAAVVFSVAVLSALAVGIAAFCILYAKQSRSASDRAAQKRRDDLMLHLALERPARVREALARALQEDGRETAVEEDTVIADGMRYIPVFTMQPLSADAVAALLRKYGEECFTIVCNGLSPEAERLARSFGRDVLGAEAVFALFERTGTTPAHLILADVPRPKLRARLHCTFSKKNARPFFVSGSLLLIMSFFTLFPRYYLIAGSLLLLTAIVVRLLGYPENAALK